MVTMKPNEGDIDVGAAAIPDDEIKHYCRN